ncbi:hypothetical protein [Luteimonas mephitis]|uniref:hypothetical protein n=1 Tax=Luteimonas mephitis TaxID=83615 RepID=UPI0004135E17|nr:hypothetical protein [Luteimonas mephitis]
MRIILAVLLALASTAALADFSVRFDRGVVTVGDSAGSVIQKAGRQPDRIVQLQNAYGAAVGERWEYYFNGKQVNLTFSGGKVTDITEIRS